MSEKTVKLTTEGTSLNQEGHCENLKKKQQDCLHINHLQQIYSGSYKHIFKKLGKNVRAFTSAVCYLPKTESCSFLPPAS